METSRTKKSIINIIAVICLKLLQIVLPFVTRTLIIHRLGIEYVGLSGLFSSIIGVLSLAELGIGGALMYAMYKPVQEKDAQKICAILAFYRKAYCTVGMIILIAGAALMPVLKFLVKEGTYPSNVNLYYIYFAYLITTVVSYLVYGYKASLLDAHQVGYIGSRVKIKMLLVQSVVQIILLLCTNNYIYYITVLPISTFMACFITGKLADKYFPNYKPSGSLELDIKDKIIGNVKALFLYKIGSVILNSVDSIVISWYLGAHVLGIYSNYYYIVASLFSLLLAVSSAVLPSVGNSMTSETKRKNYKDFMTFSFGYAWIIGWCVICIICLMQPFILVWVGEENMLSLMIAILFGLYFYAFRMGDIVGWYKDAAGLWQKDRHRPIVSSIANLVLNIILIHFIGLYGVLISTVIALLTINYPVAVKILLNYFGQSIKEYALQQIYVITVTTLNALITYKICSLFTYDSQILTLFIRVIICIVVPNIIFAILLCNNQKFRQLTNLLKKQFWGNRKI